MSEEKVSGETRVFCPPRENSELASFMAKALEDALNSPAGQRIVKKEIKEIIKQIEEKSEPKKTEGSS